MTNPHSYPRGAWWYLIRPEYQLIVQTLMQHPVCTFAQLKVFTGYSRGELQTILRPLENTGIIHRVRAEAPLRYCVYSLNKAHSSALINDFGIQA